MTTPSNERPFDEPQLLLDLSRRVTATLDLQEVLDRAFASLRHLIDFGGGAIQLIHDGFLVAAATDPPMSAEARTVRIPVGQGISGTIAATGEPIYIPDIWEDPRIHPEGKKKGVSEGVRSYFGAPLIQHGAPVGVVQVDSPLADAFSAHERSMVLAFLPSIAAAVQNAMLFERERDMLAQLEETARLKRDFLAVVSHELRTPLTSVSGFGHTLRTHADELDTDVVREIGGRIWRASRRLERVMGDLLDLSNIERGLLAVTRVPVDLRHVLEEAALEQSADHPITLDLAPDLPPVDSDEQRLHQIIGNILSNARKFSAADTSIDVRAVPEGSSITLTISDQGRGIPAGMTEKVFEPFTQLEPAATRSTEGLGVGLYLVKQLCNRMDIGIAIHSEPGKGTRVTLRIPTG